MKERKVNTLILAAGKGTRLKPLTDVIPKALVPVKGKPLVQHVVEKMIAENCNTIIVNIHHHAEQMRNFLNILGKAKGKEIVISDESMSLLDTGGAVRKATGILKEKGEDSFPMLIHNVDILSNLSVRDFCSITDEMPDIKKQTEAVLLVSDRKTKRYLLFDHDMRLAGWTNIETHEVKSPYPDIAALTGEDTERLKEKGLRLLAFSGIHLVKPTLFPELYEWPEAFSIIDFYIEMCSRHMVKGKVMEGVKILDVGKLDTLAEAESFLDNITGGN